MRLRTRGIIVSIALTLAACSQVTPHFEDKLALEPISYKDIPAWNDDAQNEALAAFMKSCQGFTAMPDTAATGQGDLLAPVTVWKAVCREAAVVSVTDTVAARQFFESAFVPMRATNHGEPSGLFTGYYVPLLKGSRTQQRPYVYPIYGLPQPGTPNYMRSQIDLGILNGHAPVLAYVDDPVALFFLHVQGSGRVALNTGGYISVGFAGNNGMAYRSIGKALIDKGLMRRENITAQTLRQWLIDHPNDMWQVMWENPSYIFFRELQGDPVGSEQVPLTPGRSLAVDQHYVTLGMPVFINTVAPATPNAPFSMLRKLMIAQDTGSAIRGPVRGDIFFGAGESAEENAGRMKEGGEMVLLVPRALALTLRKPAP